MAAKYSFKQFQAQYPNDEACLLAILERRYGKAEACPNCGIVGKLTRIEGRRAFACKEGCHIYPCVGTIFEKSSTFLTLWFHAMYLMTATRNGVSAKELQRQLGVTYKCAWRIGHQLRELMDARAKADYPGPMTGHVEVDEALVGGKKPRNNGHLLSNKSCVVGAVERGGALVGKVVSSNSRANLIPFIQENISTNAKMVNTDNWNVYRRLGKLGYKHESVNHTAKEYVRGIHHTNSIEGFWSHLKRGIVSTHVAVSPKHLQKYVNEFAFCYNHRHEPAAMFSKMLCQISRAAN